MSNVYVMDHPLIQHKIGLLRREETGSRDFRALVGEIAMLMCYEATRDLKLEDVLDYLHSKKVPKRFWPERLELIDRIPHTGSGKVKKYLLKEELEKRLKG